MIKYTLSYFNFVKDKWIDFENYSIMFTGKNGYGLPMEQGEFNYQTHLSYGTGTDSCEPSHICNLRMINMEEVSIAEKFVCKLVDVKDKHCIRLRIYPDNTSFLLNSYLIKLTDKNTFQLVKPIRSYLFSLGDKNWSKDVLVKKVSTYVDDVIDIYFGISIQLVEKLDIDIEFNLLVALDISY